MAAFAQPVAVFVSSNKPPGHAPTGAGAVFFAAAAFFAVTFFTAVVFAATLFQRQAGALEQVGQERVYSTRRAAVGGGCRTSDRAVRGGLQRAAAAQLPSATSRRRTCLKDGSPAFTPRGTASWSWPGCSAGPPRKNSRRTLRKSQVWRRLSRIVWCRAKRKPALRGPAEG